MKCRIGGMLTDAMSGSRSRYHAGSKNAWSDWMIESSAASSCAFGGDAMSGQTPGYGRADHRRKAPTAGRLNQSPSNPTTAAVPSRHEDGDHDDGLLNDQCAPTP